MAETGRTSQMAANVAAAKTTHCMMEVAAFAPSPSGTPRFASCGTDCARAFRTTAVVAGLKADPVILLDGGPSGVRALTSATLIAIHSVSMKSSLLPMLSVL